MMDSIIKMIECRGYLLEWQKGRLVEDMDSIMMEEAKPPIMPTRISLEEVVDAILYKLLGIGWSSLTNMEKHDVRSAWEGATGVRWESGTTEISLY